MKLKPQYSGNRSRKIWDAINNLKGWRKRELYACFVLLQNLEGTCLTWLNQDLKKIENSKCNRRIKEQRTTHGVSGCSLKNHDYSRNGYCVACGKPEDNLVIKARSK